MWFVVDRPGSAPSSSSKCRADPREQLGPLVARPSEAVGVQHLLGGAEVAPRREEERCVCLCSPGVASRDDEGLHEVQVVVERVPDLLRVEVLALLVVEAEDLVDLLAGYLLVGDHRELVVRGGLLEQRPDLAGDSEHRNANFANLAVVLPAEWLQCAAQRLDQVTGAEREREVETALDLRREAVGAVLLPDLLELRGSRSGRWSAGWAHPTPSPWPPRSPSRPGAFR